AMELPRAGSFCSSVFAFTNAGRVNVMVNGRAELGNAQVVSGEYFSGLQLAPAAGRLLDESDDRGAAPTAVLSYAFAQKLYGTAEKAPGQAIQLNGKPFTV